MEQILFVISVKTGKTKMAEFISIETYLSYSKL